MDRELRRILKIIDEAPDDFNSQMPAIERKVFRQISLLLKELNLMSNGRIEPSIENLNLINSIKGKLGKILISKEYANLVRRFVGNFPAIANYQTSTPLLPSTTKKTISAVARQNINNTLESLIGAGYKQEVVSKLQNTLIASVTTGGSFTDMIEQLRSQLIGTEERAGMLSRYTRTFVVDSLGQFAGQANKLIADALNSEWFRYVGSNIANTRDFCRALTRKDYVHISEIPILLEGIIDGIQVDINPRTGLPKGMIEGTNAENFIVYRGGYNCGHELIPVSDANVPRELKSIIASELRKEVLDYAKSNIIGKRVYRNELDSDVEFTKRGIKEALNQRHEKYFEKNRAIKNIVELLEEAPYIESTDNFKRDTKPNIAKYHYFSIDIAGIPSQIVLEENNIGRIIFYSITKEKTK